MNTVFTPLTQIADEIKGLLVDEKIFKSVSICEASSWQYLIQFASKIAGSPKAIINLGGGEYADDGLTRRNTFAIVVITPFGTPFFNILERIEKLFTVEFDAEGYPMYQTTSTGIRLELDRYDLFDSENKVNIVACMINTTEAIKITTQQQGE